MTLYACRFYLNWKALRGELCCLLPFHYRKLNKVPLKLLCIVQLFYQWCPWLCYCPPPSVSYPSNLLLIGWYHVAPFSLPQLPSCPWIPVGFKVPISQGEISGAYFYVFIAVFINGVGQILQLLIVWAQESNNLTPT